MASTSSTSSTLAMNNVKKNMKQTMYMSASAISQVLAYEMDVFELNHLYEQLKGIVGVVFRARDVELATPGLKLFASLLYYLSTILFCHRTIGQDLFDISLIQEKLHPTISSTSTTTSSKTPNLMYTLLQNLQLSTTTKISIVYALIPYLIERRYEISSYFQFGVQFLLSNDEEDDISSRSLSLPTESKNTWKHFIVKHIHFIISAIYRSWINMAPDRTTRIDVAFSFINEIYLAYFCFNEK